MTSESASHPTPFPPDPPKPRGQEVILIRLSCVMPFRFFGLGGYRSHLSRRIISREGAGSG